MNGPVNTVVQSEIYSIATLTTKATPVDLAGGTSVVIQAIGDTIHIATTPSFDNYFTMYTIDSGLPSGLSLQVPSTDQRLYLRAESATSRVEIWVVR